MFIKLFNFITKKTKKTVDDTDSAVQGSLEFDPKESVALCVGINEQYKAPFSSLKELFKLNDLGPTVKGDVDAISDVLKSSLQIDSTQITVITASDNGNACTKPGLCALFKENAEKVGENGIFVFYFAGHGCVEPSSRKSYLAPIYCVRKEDGIFMDDLLEWLHKAKCKAKNALFIFDCCYAGGVQLKELDGDTEIDLKPMVSVMCACTEIETNITIPELGNAIFTYFLSDYLKNLEPTDFRNIKAVMDEVADLCTHFSSLIYIYSKESEQKLQQCETHPCIKYPQWVESRCPPPELDYSPDLKGIASILKPLTSQYNLVIPAVVENWLSSPKVEVSLSVLSSKASNTEVLKEAIVCTMLHTSAVHLHEDKATLENEAVFLAIARKVAINVENYFGEVTVNYLQTGLVRYMQVIQKIFKGNQNANLKHLNQLNKKMMNLPDSTSRS